MTRRQFVDLIMSSAVATSACAQTKGLTSDSLISLINYGNMAILRMDLEAFTPPGTSVGRLSLPDFSGLLSVSPDAKSVGWVPASVLRVRADQTPNRTVLRMSSLGSIRSIAYRAGFAVSIGLSGSGLAYLIVAGERVAHRLIAIDEQSASETDLTDIVSRFDLSQVERLKPSTDGSRLAMGWRDSFIVIDAASRQIIAEGEGRFPCLSPDGKQVAFVNQGQFAVLTIGANQRRLLTDDWKADGIGAWSPEGSWLLVGARRSLLSARKLLAINVPSNEFVELWNIGDDYGSRSLWIGRHLLQPRG